MSTTAEAELTVAGPLEDVFAHFIDYGRWGSWMPRAFRPMRGPSRPLRTGDRMLVNVTGLPSMLKVERVEAPREVCWSGGLPGLMYARHSFYFEAIGATTTRIRSVEPWSGLMTKAGPLIARIIKVASHVGHAQLEGFERWYVRERGSRSH
jgi:hypothetical protein